MSDGLEQAEGLLGVAERVGVAALVPGHPAERLVDPGLAGAVTELAVQLQACGEVGAGLVVVGEPGAGVAEGPGSRGLRRRCRRGACAAASAVRWMAAHSCQ